MKQTNNAIKFLMAQYRAIFRNANLKMFLAAATAAAAMAAGSAQAGNTAKFDDTELNKAAVSGEKIINGADDPAGTYKKLELTGAAARPEGAEKLTLKVTGGDDHTIAGAAGATDVKLGNSSIKLEGANKTGTKIVVSSDTADTNLSLESVDVLKGTLEVGKDGTKGSSVTAAVTVGGTDGDAKVDLKKLAELKGSSFEVNNGAEVVLGESAKVLSSVTTVNSGSVTLGDSATISSSAINVTGGSVLVDGTTGKVAVLGSAASTVDITGGEVKTSADTKFGAITGKKITLSGEKTKISNADSLTITAGEGGFTATGGTISTADGKTITFVGDTKLKSGTSLTITGSGAAAFKGKATIEDDVKLTLGDKAKTIIAADADHSSSVLNVSKATFGKLVEGDNRKITAQTAATGQTAELHFTDADEINLASGGVGVLNDDGSGLLDKNFEAINGDGVFKVSADKVAFEKASLAVDKLTIAGNEVKVGTGDSFILSGSNLEVGHKLTVVDGSKALKIEKGSVFLTDEKNQKGNTIAAKSIVIGKDGSNKGNLNVTAGEWSVSGVDLKFGAVNVINDAVLKLSGDLTTTKDGKLIGENTAHIDATGVGTLKLGATGAELKDSAVLDLDAADVFDKDAGVISAAYADGAVTGSTTSTINLKTGDKFQDLYTMDKAKFQDFAKKAGFNGLWGVKVEGLVKPGDTHMSLGGADGIIAGIGTGYENIQADVKGSEAVANVYSAGNVNLTDGNELTIGAGTMILQNANANNTDGMFVSKEVDNKDQLAGVKFDSTATASSAIKFEGAGSVGAITIDATKNGMGRVEIGGVKTGDVTVSGGIGSNIASIGELTLNKGSSLTVQSGDVYVTTLKLAQGTDLDATGQKVVVGDATANDAIALTLNGSVTAGTLEFKAKDDVGGKVALAGNAESNVTNLIFGKKQQINIGTGGKEASESVEGSSGSYAQIFTDKLTLGEGSTLFLDPAYGQKASLLVAKEFSSINASADTSTLTSDIIVGANSALGIGFTKDEFSDVMADYLIDNGGFSNAEGAVKNALVLNQPLKINSGNKIDVDYQKTTTSPDQPITAAVNANANEVLIAEGSALILTDAAFGTNYGEAAIQFKDASGKIVSSAGADSKNPSKVILVGDFYESANELKLATVNGGNAAEVSGTLTIEAMGGLLTGTLTDATKSSFKLTVSPENEAKARAGVSKPVADMIIAKMKNKLDANKNSDGYKFLVKSLNGNKTNIDAAAHAATYAGAQQAAVAAVGTLAGAVGARVGSMGVEATAITATGSQANGGVWLAPMYQSVDVDGFNAEGASYGADVDLGGVAFGADTVNGNMRFGAVFNIGSGDADGKGNGAGLKDEFDYYGFGIYSVMGFGQLAIVGDASLSVISHEVEGLEAKGEADTTAVTMGVTGQYTISNPMVDVTPHLGARFIRLDTDAYDLTVDGNVLASTDFDVQNVFSIPLGVTLSKAFEMGGWSLAPSADLSITFNTGDTEAKSNTRFDGINTNLGLTTEVLDEVTYGVAVGLGAQYGAFGTQIGINYTGSENTDSFGVNANARYMF